MGDFSPGLYKICIYQLIITTLHYLTSKEMVRVNRISGMDTDDINVEPSSSPGNGNG